MKCKAHQRPGPRSGRHKPVGEASMRVWSVVLLWFLLHGVSAGVDGKARRNRYCNKPPVNTPPEQEDRP